jgi:hypothetical protein
MQIPNVSAGMPIAVPAAPTPVVPDIAAGSVVTQTKLAVRSPGAGQNASSREGSPGRDETDNSTSVMSGSGIRARRRGELVDVTV